MTNYALITSIKDGIIDKNNVDFNVNAYFKNIVNKHSDVESRNKTRAEFLHELAIDRKNKNKLPWETGPNNKNKI